MADNYYNHNGALASGYAAYIAFHAAALTACGWTLVDNNGNHNVYRCPDINGAPGVYFFLDLYRNAGFGTVNINAYIDWDTSTHTGITGSTTNNGATPGGDAYIYANKLGLFSTVIDGVYNTTVFAGQPRCSQTPMQSDGLCLSTGAMTIGTTTVNVSANMTGRLRVGQKVAIQNFAHNSASANASHQELVKITAVGASSLSFTATTKAYDSGAKIGPPDMLWPLGSYPGAFQSLNGNNFQCSVQAIDISQTQPSPSAVVNLIGSGVVGQASLSTAALLANQNGLSAISMVPMATQPVSTGYTAMQPIYGVLFAYIYYSGGVPATGAKFTDGTNVFVVAKGGTAPASTFFMLIGPTGDTPDTSTMGVLYTPIPAVSDSIYAVPPTASAPPNALNQGLN